MSRIHAQSSSQEPGAMAPVAARPDATVMMPLPAVHRAQSAVVMPVAAPCVPYKRAGAAIDVELLREIDPDTTSPGALATLLLPAMERSEPSAWLTAKHFIERTRGERLALLKTHLERQAPGALMNFIFKRCSKTARDELVQHMQREAPARAAAPYILSDIDNTVCPSRDARYPKSTTSYPGRAELWRAVLGEGDLSERTCFLSARFGNAVLPWHVVSRRERRVTFANLARVGITRPKVLFGSVWDLPYPTLRGINMAPLGAKKIKNFEMLRQVFPEYRYVFFGDTCEDDLHVGQVMLHSAPEHVGAVFIHDFGAAGRHWTPQQRAAAEKQGVIFYKTAPGAALAAFQRGLLGLKPSDLRCIAGAAQRELQAVAFETRRQKHAATDLLNRDLARIEAALTQVA